MIRKASEITASTVEGFKGGKGALISRDIRSAEEKGHADSPDRPVL